MEKFLRLVMTASFAVSCLAAPCGPGFLSSYIGFGASGCSIGSNTFFDFQALAGTAGATQFTPEVVLLLPGGGDADPALTILVNVSASSGSILETLFTYRISGNAYTSSTITLANSSETGAGSVTGLQNFCAGGTFGTGGVSGCTGVAGALATVNVAQNQDSKTFSAVTLLSVTDDFTLDSGIGGTARGGTLSNQFTATSAVPEPGDAALILIGISLAAVARRSFTK